MEERVVDSVDAVPQILTPRAVGQAVQRKEDARLLKGAGTYVDDIRFSGTVHAAMLRSPFAHAKIIEIDPSEALRLPGVIAFYGASDIQGKVKPFPEPYLRDLSSIMFERASLEIESCPMEPLPSERVMWVGQPVGVVVARDRYVAEDALELVNVEYEPLPVISGHSEGLMPNSPILHPSLGHNIQHRYSVETGDVAKAFAKAPHTFRTRLSMGRQIGSPLEARGLVAVYDKGQDRLSVWATTNRPFLLRSLITDTLDIPTENVRVIAPDIGGCFGGGVFPEEAIIPFLARELDRPVKWIEDRVENLQSTRHGRDQVHDVEVAFDEEGKILAVHDEFTIDVGAYNNYAITISYNVAAHLRGQFKIENFSITCMAVYSNKAPAAPVRGAGRPEAAYVMDRLVDMIADELDLDPVSVRFRNLISPPEMPYDMKIPYRDGVNIVYDNGDFPAQLRQAIKAIDNDGWRERARELSGSGYRVGVGFSSFVEASGVGPFEGAIVRVDATGHANVYTGANSHGQGLATSLAQVVADQLRISTDDVTVWPCDTSLIPYGVGTFASRSAVTAGNAAAIAAARLRGKILLVSGRILEVDPADLVIDDGRVTVRGSPQRGLNFGEVSIAAAPGRQTRVPEDVEPGLEAQFYYVPRTVVWGSGTHAAVVKVDEETGFFRLLDYVCVDDCGEMLNPMIVEGQIHGGVAHGVGNAILEDALYDDEGQFLTGTYADYLLPTAADLPSIRVEHQTFPSDGNPLGVKGVGEGGAVSPPAAIANAVVDAFRPLKLNITRAPLTPERLLRAISEAKRGA